MPLGLRFTREEIIELASIQNPPFLLSNDAVTATMIDYDQYNESRFPLGTMVGNQMRVAFSPKYLPITMKRPGVE
jgi:hypothetical protein